MLVIYKVEITETLQKTVEVNADDEHSAYLMVKKIYREEGIVLDNSNYIDTEIVVLE